MEERQFGVVGWFLPQCRKSRGAPCFPDAVSERSTTKTAKHHKGLSLRNSHLAIELNVSNADLHKNIIRHNPATPNAPGRSIQLSRHRVEILYSGHRGDEGSWGREGNTGDNHRLASPCCHRSVFASFNKISVLQTHSLNRRWERTLVVDSNARAAVPVVAIGLIVDLDHVFAAGGHDAFRVEHHASDRLFVGIGVGN